MKKLLLGVCAISLATTAMAVPLTLSPETMSSFPHGADLMSVPFPKNERAMTLAPSGVSADSRATRAAEEPGTMTMDYSVCYNPPYSAVGLGANGVGLDVWMGFEVTPEEATKYAGANVTAINFYNGADMSNQQNPKNNITKGTVYICSSISGTTPDVIMSQEVTMSNTAFEYNHVVLDSPYVIEEGKGFFVMLVIAPTKDVDYCIVVDGVANNGTTGCIIGVTDGKQFQWLDNNAPYIGNVWLSMTIEGQDFPTNGVAVYDVYGPQYAVVGSPCNISTAIYPDAAGAVDSIELEVMVPGAEEPQVYSLSMGEQPLLYHDLIGTADGLDLMLTEVGENNIVLTVTKVNGEPNTSADASKSVTVTCLGEGQGYDHTFLVEEGTGTWCGWCPAGMVFMEYLKENYPDVLRVAVHASSSTSNDPMQVSSARDLINQFEGFPSLLVNRATVIMPTGETCYEDFDTYVEQVNAVPAIAEISDLQLVSQEDGSIKVAAKARFALDIDNPNKRYGVSFEVVEDFVGPYVQTNYYAGGQYGPMDGWGSKPRSVPTTYMDVLRVLSGGLAGFDIFPAQIEAGKEYGYETTIKTSTVKAVGYYVNAIITDNLTGEVLNARQMAVGDVAVKDIEAASEVQSVEWYDLNGIRLAAPVRGVNIKRTVMTDGTVRHDKVMVTD